MGFGPAQGFASAAAPKKKDTKESCRLATAAALPASTYSAATKRLTADANGALTVDGVAVAVGDRLLNKNHADAKINGIFRVVQPGTAGTPWILERAYDFDTSEKITANAYAVVSEGTVNKDKAWQVISDDPVTLDTDDILWARFGPGLGKVEINAQAGDYTLALTDASKLVTIDHADPKNLTVPPNSDVAFEIGAVILILQKGAGAVTVVAGVGVTINPSPNSALVLEGQWAQAVLTKIATNTWTLAGNLQGA